MKGKIYFAALITASLVVSSLAGCQQKTQPSSESSAGTEVSEEQTTALDVEEETAPLPEYSSEHRGREIQESVLSEIDPAACEPSFREFLGDRYSDYQALMQALVNREPQVSVDASLAESLVRHMEASPYGVLSDSVQIQDGQITLVYRFDESEHRENKELLDQLFLKLVNEHVSSADNEMEKILALYQGLMEIETNGTYLGDADEVPDLLNVLESGDAQSSQFAEMLSFALQLLDMEAFPMVINADYPEVVVYAKLGDQFFFFDPYYEAMASMGEGLMGFGMLAADLNSYLNSSEAEAWSAQGEYSYQTLNLVKENPFASFRTMVSWKWGEDHTIEVTDLSDQSYLFRTDTLTYEGEAPSAAKEAALEEMYPVFDSILRTMYEDGKDYDASDSDFVWSVLANLSCNYGYYFPEVSYEETGFVHVPAETMQKMAAICFQGLILPQTLPEGCAAERLSDGSFRLPLVSMSENWIRVEDMGETEEGQTATVGFYHPGSEPGEEEKLQEVLFTCVPAPSSENSDQVLAFQVCSAAVQ